MLALNPPTLILFWWCRTPHEATACISHAAQTSGRLGLRSPDETSTRLTCSFSVPSRSAVLGACCVICTSRHTHRNTYAVYPDYGSPPRTFSQIPCTVPAQLPNSRWRSRTAHALRESAPIAASRTEIAIPCDRTPEHLMGPDYLRTVSRGSSDHLPQWRS